MGQPYHLLHILMSRTPPVQIETSSESSMPSTPIMGNGRHGKSPLQDGGKPWSWLTEERLVTALSAKYEYEVSIDLI